MNMETETTHALMKHFAGVLKQYALQKSSPSISPSVLKYVTRKDLITIISDRYDREKPLELVALENEELLSMIDNEMYLIAYFSTLWSKDEGEQHSPIQHDKSKASKNENSK